MTRNVTQSNFGSSIIYEDRLPVKIELLQTRPESAELMRVGALNDEVLRMVLSLDDVAMADKNDDDRNNELQRLEFKVNLILDMLGELYAQRVDFPQTRFVKLGALAASWQLMADEFVPAEGACLSLHIYLTQRYPRPLVLSGQVKQVLTDDAGTRWLEVDLLAMPQQVQDSLERFIFRQHRRYVAFSRRANPAG